MRFSSTVAATVALSAGSSWALVPPSAPTTKLPQSTLLTRWPATTANTQRRKTARPSFLPHNMSVMPQDKEKLDDAPFFASTADQTNGRSSQEIANELSSGKTLDEKGIVIDFASVKDTTSRAERALAASRKKYEASGSSISSSSNGGRLMGINDEVVAEVGYEIGEFMSEFVDVASGETAEELVQKCGQYIRSKASAGTFPQLSKLGLGTWNNKGSSAGGKEFSSEDTSRFDRLLARAYEESGIVTAAFAKTFYLGTQVLPEPAMKAIWAVYVWCRRTDEIVDAPRPEAQDPNDEMLTDLSEWEIRLERLFDRGEVVDVLDLPLLDCKVKYPKLPITPFLDMIRGMLMDIPGLGQDRYDTWNELHLYCYRVAGTVGLMSMPVFGCAPGFTDEIAKEPALSLGVAFQITNILRDVGEDAEKRGRVYLPQIDMDRFGVTEQQLKDKKVDQNYTNLMKFEIARARMYYARALRGVPMLSAESRLPVQLSLDAYGKILDKIEDNDYDSLTKRAYVGKWEKLAGLPASWYRTLDISKSLPLPGDGERTNLEEYEKKYEVMVEKIWAEASQ